MISLHVPLTDDTEGMIDAAALARMKKGSFLVNVARGGVVDEAALADAVKSGHLAGAALDVYSSEPLEEDSPLRGVPNLLLTPHLGASTDGGAGAGGQRDRRSRACARSRRATSREPSTRRRSAARR